jgi:hypothetical protein
MRTRARKVGGGEVDHGPLEQRPDALNRLSIVRASLAKRA